MGLKGDWIRIANCASAVRVNSMRDRPLATARGRYGSHMESGHFEQHEADGLKLLLVVNSPALHEGNGHGAGDHDQQSRGAARTPVQILPGKHAAEGTLSPSSA